MQTLQCFSASLNLHDAGSLHRLRNHLQALPQRLLSRSDQRQDYLLGNTRGDCNYQFKLRLDGGYFQTGVLHASATKEDGDLPIPLKCRWSRKVGDLVVDIPGVTSNMYQISADDVGTEICVEAEPADVDDGLYGVVTSDIGPFELDPATRRSLDTALGKGSTRFIAIQSRVTGEALSVMNRQEVAVDASTDSVRVVPLQGGVERTNREVAVTYSADYPKVIIHPLDTTKFQLVMNEQATLHLVAKTRTQRDLIAVTIRCFHSKKYLSSENILDVLLPVRPSVPGHIAPANDDRLDASVVLERVLKELNRVMQLKETHEKVLRNTKREREQLQEQLLETISACTEVIENLEQSEDGSLTGAVEVSPEQLQDSLSTASAQNQMMISELQSLRKHLTELQIENNSFAETGHVSGPDLGQQLRSLREERNLLQTRLAEVTLAGGSVHQRNQAEHIHVLELKRHRQDVENLHSQKEELRRHLQDKDVEKEQLQQSFLYVKGQLDKVQLRQANAASSEDGDSSGEIQRLGRILETVENERCQLALRLEAILRECDKEKAYREQTLDRVMSANAKLMEERDRSAAEVVRVSQLYSNAVGQLKADSDLLMTVGSISSADGLDVATLQEQLAELDAQLEQRDQENESLKNRIRRLAVA